MGIQDSRLLMGLGDIKGKDPEHGRLTENSEIKLGTLSKNVPEISV